MNESLVSVIVPVYNVQEYLEECLESIVHQTYEALEIILVDDGSTDGSMEICDAYLKKDARIKVIHQQNAGAANARKSGIMAATAPYICFVDADDTIDADMIRYFMENIGDADILTSGCRREEADGTITQRYDSFDQGIYKTKAEMEYVISNMMMFHDRIEDGVLPYLWNKLYRTDIIRKVIDNIDERIRCDEDRELILKYLLRCNSVVVTKESFYCYRYRDISMVHAANTYYLQDLNYFYNSLKLEFERQVLKDSLIRQLQKFVMSRTLMATKMMGFISSAQSIRYIFPFYNLLDGKRLILYGAGVVGNDYYRQMREDKRYNIVLWVDKNYKKLQEFSKNVEPINRILDFEFDAIIIAVKKEEMALRIMEELKEIGISVEKMFWRSPIDILI